MRRLFWSVVALAIAAPAVAEIPPRSISPPKDQVDDEFIAYLHGLIYKDRALFIDRDALAEKFPEFVPVEPTPFNDIELLVRTTPAQSGSPGSGRREVSIHFSSPLRYGVSVDILNQPLAELQGSRRISFEEVVRPPSLPLGVEVDDEVSDLVVMVLVGGYMRVDFARWLDFIGARLLEDVDVLLIAVLRYRDQWYAVLGGTSPTDRPMSGVLEMQSSRFLVNPPRPVTKLAHDLVEWAK